MLAAGLQGSPRKKGNTAYLLDLVLEQAAAQGAETLRVDAAYKNIRPCMGCTNCERKGFCAIDDDDMAAEIYPLLRRADLVILATPIYFYNTTSQLKKLIDRSQTLWARKYRLGLEDPGRPWRKGLMLAVGATRGKNLFEGTALTARYFFDAAGASFEGSLTYRQVENMGDMKKHAAVHQDAKALVDELSPFLRRRKVLFACRENACRSQMAAAFARHTAGNLIDAASAGTQPAADTNPVMQEVMAEIGIDTAFHRPRPLAGVLEAQPPDIIVTMGCGVECPYMPGTKILDWDLPDPAGGSKALMRELRDEIRNRVESLVSELGS